MGNQCACQKIESEEEILSRIISNLKLRDIETKSAYVQFLSCIDLEDNKIDYFLYFSFITKIIGNNIYYKIPQANFFENLRKKSDSTISNIKAIGITIILFSLGEEKTKISFIVEYFFYFYKILNEKNIREFLGYIIDSQTENCILSFREIYSYESVKAFKEIYSKNRRKKLINFIYENFESVKCKYIKKILIQKNQEKDSYKIQKFQINKHKYKYRISSVSTREQFINTEKLKNIEKDLMKNKLNRQNPPNTPNNIKDRINHMKKEKKILSSFSYNDENLTSFPITLKNKNKKNFTKNKLSENYEYINNIQTLSNKLNIYSGKFNQEILRNLETPENSAKEKLLEINSENISVKNLKSENYERYSNKEKNNTNEISFCNNKNSSNKNVFENLICDENKNLNLEKNENKIILNDKIIESDEINLNDGNYLENNITSGNNTSTNNKNYEKYNKGLYDKSAGNSIVELKDVEHSEFLGNLMKQDINNKNHEIDFQDININYLIMKEFLELSFPFFNGDTIRNWLYDYYIKERAIENIL